ncbi:hypothetical protein U1Q18_016924 [Sarracenia purpurea var. burkii]
MARTNSGQRGSANFAGEDVQRMRPNTYLDEYLGSRKIQKKKKRREQEWEDMLTGRQTGETVSMPYLKSFCLPKLGVILASKRHDRSVLTLISLLEGHVVRDLATTGVLYLCNFVDGRKMKMLEVPQEQLQLSGKSCGYLTSSETPSLKGLKEIVDTLVPEDANMSTTEGSVQDSTDKLDDVPGPDEV